MEAVTLDNFGNISKFIGVPEDHELRSPQKTFRGSQASEWEKRSEGLGNVAAPSSGQGTPRYHTILRLDETNVYCDKKSDLIWRCPDICMQMCNHEFVSRAISSTAQATSATSLSGARSS
jgi:hypothetical protein